MNKKFLISLIIGILFLLIFINSSIWTGTTVGDRIWYNSGYPYVNNSYRVTDFINVSGTNFTLSGEPYKFIGVNAYYLSDYATNHTYDDDGNEITNSQQYALEILNEAHFLNVNVIRTWANMMGSDDSFWIINQSGGHYNLFEVGEPGNYSNKTLEALDWVIYQASKRDIRLQLVLINNWDDYGGMRWYAQKSPTTDKTYQWINDTDDAHYWEFHDQFYNDTNCMNYFKNYTSMLLNRNNTYTGVLYKNDPAIFSWLLANEARAKSDADGSNNLIKEWTTNMTAYIKSIDTNHLVGLGIEGWGNPWEGTSFIDDHNGTGVDYATYALHPSQWKWFAERSEHSGDLDWVDEDYSDDKYIDFWTNESNVSYNNRYEGSYVPNYNPALARHQYKDWVRQHVEWANDMGMPVLLQELAENTSLTVAVKSKFFNQTLYNFYETGGDGIMMWNLNHDQYYYSTDTNGTMDDGFSFYVSSDTTLKTKSQSVINAFDYAVDNDWVTLLNDYKFDFVVNSETAGIHNDSAIADDCVGNWKFEQNAVDSSGNGNDGTITEGVTNTTGIVGYGYEFDGSGRIAIPDDNSLNISKQISVSVWTKIPATGTFETIIGKNNALTAGWQIYRRPSDNLVTMRVHTDGDGDSAVQFTYQSDVWQHLVLVYNGSTLKGYRNGVFALSTPANGNITYTTRPLYIGHSNTGSMTRINGTIDEVQIFNRSLSSTEIQTIYNQSLKTQPGVASMNNCSLYLNIKNATDWTGYFLDQTTSSIIEDTDYTLTKQFTSDTEEAYWYTSCCDNYSMCINSSSTQLQVQTDTPIITLLSSDNSGGVGTFEYNVSDNLDIAHCSLYINDVLNTTDSTVTKDATQEIVTTLDSNTNYDWYIECEDVGDNLEKSETRNTEWDYYIFDCKSSGWESNKVYRLNNSVSTTGYCMDFDVDNITLDCYNYILTGDGVGGDRGVSIYNDDNIIIKNCNINHFYYGLVIQNSDNNTIFNNTCDNSVRQSFYLIARANSNNLTNNTVINSAGEYNPFHIAYDSCNNSIDTSNIWEDQNLPVLFIHDTTGYTLENINNEYLVTFCNVNPEAPSGNLSPIAVEEPAPVLGNCPLKSSPEPAVYKVQVVLLLFFSTNL